MAIAQTGGNFPNNLLIPEIWSLKLQEKFYAESLIAKICNTDWEGEIKSKGQTVHIRKRPDVAVYPHVANAPVNWQDVVDEEIQFTIDYAYDAAVRVPKAKMKQMDINIMSELQTEIAYRQMNQEDTVVFSTAYANAGSTVTSSGVLQPIQGTSYYIMTDIAKLRTKLNRLNVPQSDRILVVSPEVEELMIQATAARYDVSGIKNDSERYGQFMNKIYGFTVYSSNFVVGAGTSGSPYKCFALHKSAITFARQVVDTEIHPELQEYFGAGIKSLNVFGFKVVTPDAFVLWNAQTA